MAGTCDGCSDRGWSAAALAAAVQRHLEEQGLAPDPPRPSPRRVEEARCEPLEWAASGAMWLTGWPHTAPMLSSGAPAIGLLAGAALIEDLNAESVRPVRLDARVVLSGRAGLLGLRRRGQTSANGSCRLLPTADGCVAVNLPRPSDTELLPAVLGEPVEGDGWAQLERVAVGTTARDVADRAQLVGIPASALPTSPVAGPPVSVVALGEPRHRAPGELPLVVDLSSMWAGPLCAHVLGRSGTRVVKVESAARLDGARRGAAAFFDWLHGGHRSVVLDFTTERGRSALSALVEQADVVVEASRPRALQQLSIDATDWVEDRPGRTWVSITGYGRTNSASDRVAFGDDAAVAGGLVAWDGDGRPVFCGDAIADPLTGVYAALGALASITSGGGHLLDVALSRVAGFVASVQDDGEPPEHRVEATGEDRWILHHGGRAQEILRPAPPVPSSPAAAPGADTDDVSAELGLT